MDNQLLTLSKIFTERLFRIPDYQRGYAWTEKQLKDFWNDIQQLEVDHNHYTGVLTLEDVSEDVYRQWEDDRWIIEAKSYQPYFIVDGQQRLTTAIILIQTILERLQLGQKLNYTDRKDIQRRFIFDSKDDGISRSYVFGYEKDNPSYEFLKTKIFCERSSTGRLEETVYTQNLEKAKEYFLKLIESFQQPELEVLYRKVTQQLLFNIFIITEDVDVCVAFETMNNRGKPLSHLELLKNRLIYLSLKFDAPKYEQQKLRRAINDCWKALYHNLGRNKNQLLDDDRFLYTHYIIYFGKKILKRFIQHPFSAVRSYGIDIDHIDYASDLLEKHFVPRNVMSNAPIAEKVTLKDIYRYVSSLQDAVEFWYKIWNPFDSDFSDELKIWLDKLNRLDRSHQILSLVLVFFQSFTDEKRRLIFLQVIERFLFTNSIAGDPILAFSRHYYNEGISLDGSLNFTIRMMNEEKITKFFHDKIEELLKKTDFIQEIILRFQAGGFYRWTALRYFLFEYNLDLQMHSKTERPKIFWPEFTESKKEYITVEHIFPKQARHEYWRSRFKGLTQKQRRALRNSLGNLLPLSKPKNSSLSNNPFPDKVDGKKCSVVGYRYGSYAENEVSKEKEWTPMHILQRGLLMLDFMERRWGIKFGSEKDKKKMLGLDFMRQTKLLTKTSNKHTKD